MPKHKLKSAWRQPGRFCRKACRSLIAKMAACRFRRWAVTAVSPLSAMRLIMAHFKFAKLSRQFFSRAGVHLNLTPARRGCSSTQPGFTLLPRRESVPLLLSLAALVSFLSITYITLAEATPAQAAAVSIQTCSGISGDSNQIVEANDPSYPYFVAYGDSGYPHTFDRGPVSIDRGPVSLSGSQTHNIGAAIASKSIKKEDSITVQVTGTIPNSDYDPSLSPGDPDYEPPTIQDTKDKTIWVEVHDKDATLAGWFEDINVYPAAPGAQDTSSNLTSQVTQMRASIISPSASDGTFAPSGDSQNISSLSVSWSHTRSVGGASGTRRSDGLRTNSSPANYYDQGTIEAWSWSAGWTVGLRGSATSTFLNYRVISDRNYHSTSPGVKIPFMDSVTISAGSSVSGSVSGCSRTLVVKVPTCTPKLRTHPDNAGVGLLLTCRRRRKRLIRMSNTAAADRRSASSPSVRTAAPI